MTDTKSQTESKPQKVARTKSPKKRTRSPKKRVSKKVETPPQDTVEEQEQEKDTTEESTSKPTPKTKKRASPRRSSATPPTESSTVPVVFKSSAMKKLVYRAGVQKVKGDALDRLGMSGMDFVEAFVKKLIDSLGGESGTATNVNFDQVADLGEKVRTSVDLDHPPNKMCPVFSESRTKGDKSKPGEAADRKIKFYQAQTDCLFLSRSTFGALVKNTLKNMNGPNLKFKKTAMELLQAITESYIVELLSHSVLATEHRGGKTLESSDLSLVNKLKTRRTRV